MRKSPHIDGLPEMSLARRGGRPAFTAVELCVAVAVVAVLFALLLPAVQQAREAARRLTCKSRLGQIGLAVTAYDEVFGELPTLRWLTIPRASFDAYSPQARILPFLEQHALYDGLNWSLMAIDRRDAPLSATRTVRNTRVAAFLCPSDRVPDGSPGNHVRVNLGLYRQSAGAFAYIGSSGSRAHVDRSKLVALGERIVGSFDATRHDGQRDGFYDELPDAVHFTTDEMRRRCDRSDRRIWEHTFGRYWIYNSSYDTAYFHNAPPNAPRATCFAGPRVTTHGTGGGLSGPRSRHAGTVNAAFLDGHVESVADGIDQPLWERLGTHQPNPAGWWRNSSATGGKTM